MTLTPKEIEQNQLHSFVQFSELTEKRELLFKKIRFAHLITESRSD